MANYIDYFNPKNVTFSYTMPDGKQKIVFRKLTEGDRLYLQQFTDEVIMTNDGETKIKVNTAESKKAIVKRSMVSWSLKTRDSDGNIIDVPFTEENKDRFLEILDPNIADEIYALIEEKNPWLRKNVLNKKK